MNLPFVSQKLVENSKILRHTLHKNYTGRNNNAIDVKNFLARHRVPRPSQYALRHATPFHLYEQQFAELLNFSNI